MSSTRALPNRLAAESGRPQNRSASRAGSPVSSSIHPARTRCAMTDAGRVYSEAVLDQYLWLPGTPTRTSRHDRRLVKTLYERGVPLAVVKAALLLGAARRSFRKRDAPVLPPIRTLHYFLPIVEELLEQPPATGYLEYLEHRLFPLADAKAGVARTTMANNSRDPSP